jgi:hypothetical protein
MPNYRKPTEKETEKLNKARKMMAEGIEGEKDIFSRTMPTMAKAARDEMRAAKALRETVPASAREGEAYQEAGYKKGGKVKKMRKFQDGGFAQDQGGGYTSDRTPEQRASDIGLKEGSPDYVKALETLRRMKKTARLPGDTVQAQSENQALRKAKDTIKAAGSRLMDMTPQGRITKAAASMARRPQIDFESDYSFEQEMGMKKGGKVSSASKRADGIAIRGKTRA